MPLSNWIRLDQVIYVFCRTRHPAYITYGSLYYNLLNFNRIMKFGIKNARTKFDQEIYILYYTRHPAYITYKSFCFSSLIFNPILQLDILHMDAKIHSVSSCNFDLYLVATLHKLHIYSLIIIDWLLFQVYSLVSWMWVPNFIQLGRVVYRCVLYSPPCIYYI